MDYLILRTKYGKQQHQAPQGTQTQTTAQRRLSQVGIQG